MHLHRSGGLPGTHGNWPLYLPPDRGSEDWALYQAVSGPLVPCGPDCDADCVCPDQDDDGEPIAA